jgi:branched-chain amino acid transport system permease protein
VLRSLALNYVALPWRSWGLTDRAGRPQNGIALNLLLSLIDRRAARPYLYRIAFQPMADASVLTLLIASVGAHLALQGLGLIFFGAEGLRGPAFSSARCTLGPLRHRPEHRHLCRHLLLIVGAVAVLRRTLYGKALRATAVNRLGARLSASAPRCRDSSPSCSPRSSARSPAS